MKEKKPRVRKSLGKLYWESIAQNWQFVVLIALVGTSLIAGVLLTNKFMVRASEIPKWPGTSAIIKKANITQKAPLDPVAVELELEYQVQGQTYQASYRRSWIPHSGQSNPKNLAAGQTINIKYQPENPKLISLHPDGP